MQHSRYDTGPGFFQGASNVDASHGTFNQYNYNNAMNDEMVVRRSSYHITNMIEFRP
jgi:hypothetical protein